MAIARTWNLRLNLDAFNALAGCFYTDADRALAFQGISLGANGGERPEGAPTAFLKGWEFGAAMRQEAEEYREGRRENGKSGGRPKKPHGIPHGLPEGSPHGIPQGEPRGEPNPQSTIHNPTTNNIPPTPKGAMVGKVQFSPVMFDHMIPVTMQATAFVEAWHDWVQDRKARHKPVTEIGARDQLAKLVREAGDPTTAVSWIRESIANGWQGIFPPKLPVRHRAAPAPQFNGFSQTNYERGSNDADIKF